MELKIKKFKRKHLMECSKIMAPTWALSKNLPLVKEHEKVCFFIMKYYFIKSSYKIVVFNDKTILGFLTADYVLKNFSRLFYKIKSYFDFIVFKFQLWVFLLFKKNDEKKQISDFFKALLVKKVVPIDSRACSEIVSLFVKTSCQGLGLGRKLLDTLLSVCKKNKIESIYLFTDTDCNYKYYDNMGFKNILTYSGTIGVSSKEENAFSFLYKLNL